MNKDDKNPRCRCGAGGLTRRQFLSSMGAGAVAIPLSAHLASREAKAGEVIAAGERTPITLSVNGRRHTLLVEARTPLLTALRDGLGLTGAKPGCERGECGACTVLIDDTPRYSCMTLAVEAQGAQITTLEGLMRGEGLGPVQQAFVELDAFQCGYCTPGQIMSVEGLLRAVPQPSEAQVRAAVSGNLCRCGTYVNIFAAARRAAEMKRAGG